MVKGLKILMEVDRNSKEIQLGELDYFYVKKESDYYSIYIDKLNIYEDVSLKKNDLLYLQINTQSSYIMYLICFQDFNLKKGLLEKGQIKAQLYSGIHPYKVNFYLDLLRSWNNNQKLYNWRSLTELRNKIWIKACLNCSGIQTQAINKNIELDCTEVNNLSDLYCYLGELFFGDKGYLGSNLDGLSDCLSSINAISEFRITFKNFEHLKTQLDTPKNYIKDYTDILLEIFGENISKVEFA